MRLPDRGQWHRRSPVHESRCRHYPLFVIFTRRQWKCCSLIVFTFKEINWVPILLNYCAKSLERRRSKVRTHAVRGSVKVNLFLRYCHLNTLLFFSDVLWVMHQHISHLPNGSTHNFCVKWSEKWIWLAEIIFTQCLGMVYNTNFRKELLNRETIVCGLCRHEFGSVWNDVAWICLMAWSVFKIF